MKNNTQSHLMTQFVYEKSWVKISDEEAIRLINDEMKEGDGAGTLKYIKEAAKNGKVITVGDCRFKMERVP